jgi:ABC-type dipeptide/oligopeptide/nickel transport system permease component
MSGFIVMMLGTLTVTGTLISDVLLAVVDPRIKLTR